jgi:hypothetical protein
MPGGSTHNAAPASFSSLPPMPMMNVALPRSDARFTAGPFGSRRKMVLLRARRVAGRHPALAGMGEGPREGAELERWSRAVRRTSCVTQRYRYLECLKGANAARRVSVGGRSVRPETRHDPFSGAVTGLGRFSPFRFPHGSDVTRPSTARTHELGGKAGFGLKQHLQLDRSQARRQER